EGILPRTFEDYVSLLAPMAMETPAVVRGLARWSRGGRALTAADEQERIALGEYLKGFDADTAAYNQDIRNVDAMGRAVLDRARMNQKKAIEDALNAYETGSAEVYGQKMAEVRAAELQYAEALEQTRKHEAALASARQLPERYQPQMPPRTALDVRRDFDVLQQGGEAAERLMRQMGVTTPEEASAFLVQEARQFPEAADILRQ